MSASIAPAPPQSMKPFTVAAVADRWGCSTTFVYGLIASGNLPAFKLGGKLIRISQQAVDDYENNNATARAAPAEVQLDTDKNVVSPSARLIRHRWPSGVQ